MFNAPLAQAEERETAAPEREAAGNAGAMTTWMLDKCEEEAAEQPAQQQPAAPLEAPALQQAPNDSAINALAEGAALPEQQEAAGAGALAEEAKIDVPTPKDHFAEEAQPEPEEAANAPASGSNHRVKPHLAGDTASIALVITSGNSREAKVAQRVVNRSGQKHLQGFFAQIFETVTAS